MARISLRAYHREIEDLIETRQYEQAIAHCRHILKFYPKDVNSYRLLGKAYLESQRYGDASDIFLRVLSTVPDDFVSHALYLISGIGVMILKPLLRCVGVNQSNQVILMYAAFRINRGALLDLTNLK